MGTRVGSSVLRRHYRDANRRVADMSPGFPRPPGPQERRYLPGYHL